jgi:hypothetical protein
MKQFLEDSKWMVLSDKNKTISKYAWSHDTATERSTPDVLVDSISVERMAQFFQK